MLRDYHCEWKCYPYEISTSAGLLHIHPPRLYKLEYILAGNKVVEACTTMVDTTLFTASVPRL